MQNLLQCHVRMRVSVHILDMITMVDFLNNVIKGSIVTALDPPQNFQHLINFWVLQLQKKQSWIQFKFSRFKLRL